MIALILVGGEGTRLRPLTYDIPKPMLPIVERPIIARIVEWLARYGIERAVLSLGYRPDAFLQAFPDSRWAGVDLVYAVEPEPLDTAGAIRFAAQFAGVEGERLVIVNGDILTDLDLDALVTFHEDHRGEATIALTPVDDPSAFGVVPTDESGRVIAFVEKPPPGEAPTNFINAGTYIFEPKVMARIGEGRVSVERKVFPAIVEDGALFAMASDAYWLDTGLPERYLQAQFDVLSGKRPAVEIPEHVRTSAGTFLAPGAKNEATTRGLVFIGAGACVANDVELIDCVIGAGCTVAPGVRIENSLLLEGAQIAEDVVCENSIIGPAAKIGRGTSCLNLTVVGRGAVIADDQHLDSARVPV